MDMRNRSLCHTECIGANNVILSTSCDLLAKEAINFI